jgi:hypothetical protein
MIAVPSIVRSGLDLLEGADRTLQRSAAALTRSGEPDDREAAPAVDASGDVVGAAVGAIYGRTAGRIGVALIAVGRDVETSLLDVLA